jgi:hypothetical protein
MPKVPQYDWAKLTPTGKARKVKPVDPINPKEYKYGYYLKAKTPTLKRLFRRKHG